MANDILKSSTAPAPAIAQRTAYGRFADQRQSPSFVGSLLRFDGKQGKYSYGADKKEMKEGTLLIAGMFTLKHGWVKWQDGKQAREILSLVEDESVVPVEREELGDLDQSSWEKMGSGRDAQVRDPWQKKCTIVFADPDTRDLYTFSTTSEGGIEKLMQLSDEYDIHMRQLPNEIPIVALKSSSYPSNYGGTTFKPEFRIVDWIDKNAISMKQEDKETTGAAPRRVVAKVTPIKKGAKPRF